MTKLVSYEHAGSQGFGLVTGAGVVALVDRGLGATNLQELIAQGVDLRRVEDKFGGHPAEIALDELRYLPPVHAPEKIICVGLNYNGHMTETGRQPVAHPTLFSRWSDSHVGHGEPLVLPAVSTKFDYEGELAVVIGRRGRHIPKSDAMAYVAGYSCYNDGSIRDWQRHTTQFLPGKNFEASGSFGPWLVAANAVPDYRELRLRTRLNGRVLQEASLADLIFDIPTLIEYASSFTTLNPGDVLVTGTPDGVGAFRDPQLWMGAGDVVEVEIDGVGLLSNKVVAEQGLAAARKGWRRRPREHVLPRSPGPGQYTTSRKDVHMPSILLLTSSPRAELQSTRIATELAKGLQAQDPGTAIVHRDLRPSPCRISMASSPPPSRSPRPPAPPRKLRPSKPRTNSSRSCLQRIPSSLARGSSISASIRR